MNLRKLLITAGLTLCAGAGAVLAANSNESPIEAKAAVPSVIYFQWTGDWSEWDNGKVNPSTNLYAHFADSGKNGLTTWHGNLKDEIVTKDDVQYAKFTVPSGAAYVVFNIYGIDGWNYDEWNHQTTDIALPTDGKDTFTLGSKSEATGWKYGGSWSTYETPKHTVSRMAVEFVNGVAQSPADWSLGSDSVEEGESHSAPDTIIKNLEHFGGWFSDATCQTAYTGTASVTSAFTIYAKYTRLTLDSYFYWLDKDSTDISDGYVYFWNEYQTEYNGIALSDCLVSEVLRLEDQGHLYKIPVPSTGDISCLLHNSSDTVKTFDITSITRGAVYYTWWDNNGGDGKSYYAYSPVANEGLAADFLIEFESYRNAVSASGSTKQYSICGINPSNAAYLYGLYEGLDSDVQTIVNNSCTYTYAGKDTTDEQTTWFSDIMPEIYTIALRDATFAQDHQVMHFSPISNGDNSAAIILTIAALVSVGAAGAFFIRRRKEN